MSDDLAIGQRDFTNDQLQRIADAVEALVGVLREQASTERTVELATIEPMEFELATIEQVGGPAGDLIGYAVIDKDDMVRGELKASIAAADRLRVSYERSESDAEWAPYRVGAVYDLPQELEP